MKIYTVYERFMLRLNLTGLSSFEKQIDSIISTDLYIYILFEVFVLSGRTTITVAIIVGGKVYILV